MVKILAMMSDLQNVWVASSSMSSIVALHRVKCFQNTHKYINRLLVNHKELLFWTKFIRMAILTTMTSLFWACRALTPYPHLQGGRYLLGRLPSLQDYVEKRSNRYGPPCKCSVREVEMDWGQFWKHWKSFLGLSLVKGSTRREAWGF